MSDKYRDIHPVVPSFVSGEQLDPSKVSAWATQIDRGIQSIENALGDLFSHSWPYFPSGAAFPNNTPTGYWGFQQDGTDLGSTLAQRHLQQPNLARAIGPMSVLNPRILPGLSVTIQSWTMPSEASRFRLPFKPDANPTFNDNVTVFLNLVASPEEVQASGDYHVDLNTGWVHTYLPVGIGGADTTVDFDVDVDLANASDSYPESTLNVIPDSNQTVDRCTVTDSGGGEYLVVFPTITHAQSDYHELSTLLDDLTTGGEDLSSGSTPQLPQFIQDNYAVGEYICDGLVAVWDHTDNSIVENCRFRYQSATSVTAVPPSGITLTASTNQYSIIVISVDLARTVDFIRWRMRRHSHTGMDGSEVVSHDDLADLFAPTWLLGNIAAPIFVLPFVKSELEGNPHPQYLHRGGYRSTEDGGAYDGDGIGANWGGALLGPLLLANANVYADTGAPANAIGQNGDTTALGLDSFRVNFITTQNWLGWREVEDTTHWAVNQQRRGMQIRSELSPSTGVVGNHLYFYGDPDDTGATEDAHHYFWGDLYVYDPGGAVTGGDLYVENDVEIGNDLDIGNHVTSTLQTEHSVLFSNDTGTAVFGVGFAALGLTSMDAIYMQTTGDMQFYQMDPGNYILLDSTGGVRSSATDGFVIENNSLHEGLRVGSVTTGAPLYGIASHAEQSGTSDSTRGLQWRISHSTMDLSGGETSVVIDLSGMVPTAAWVCGIQLHLEGETGVCDHAPDGGPAWMPTMQGSSNAHLVYNGVGGDDDHHESSYMFYKDAADSQKWKLEVYTSAGAVCLNSAAIDYRLMVFFYEV